jgi:hypothetical protein
MDAVKYSPSDIFQREVKEFLDTYVDPSYTASEWVGALGMVGGIAAVLLLIIPCIGYDLIQRELTWTWSGLILGAILALSSIVITKTISVALNCLASLTHNTRISTLLQARNALEQARINDGTLLNTQEEEKIEA